MKCTADLSKYSRLFSVIAGKWFTCIVLLNERWTVNIILSTKTFSQEEWKIVEKLLFHDNSRVHCSLEIYASLYITYITKATELSS